MKKYLNENTMKNSMYKIAVLFLLLISVFLLGCSQRIQVSPNKLPKATVGQPYYVEIKITGGRVVTGALYTSIEPVNGLKIEPIISDYYNFVKVYGTPLKPVKTTIIIAGETYGTMYPGSEFEKKYELDVTE